MTTLCDCAAAPVAMKAVKRAAMASCFIRGLWYRRQLTEPVRQIEGSLDLTAAPSAHTGPFGDGHASLSHPHLRRAAQGRGRLPRAPFGLGASPARPWRAPL